MIKGINSYSPAIIVSDGMPYMPPISPGALSAGQLRYNPNTQATEVYDGVSWLPISPRPASISLSPEVEGLLVWLRQHRMEVETEKNLRESHPAVKKAWEQYQVVKTLSRDIENA